METPTHHATIEEFLRLEVGLCSHCISLVVPPSADIHPSPSKNATCSCSMCFGLSSPKYQQEQIAPLILKNLSPYCKGRGNYFTKESPTINIPLLILVRAQAVLQAAECFLRIKATQSNSDDTIISTCFRLRSAEEIYAELKETLRSSIRELLDRSISSLEIGDEAECREPNLTQQLHEEESGYLAAHVLILPQFPTEGSEESAPDPSCIIPPSLNSHICKHKHQIKQSQHRMLNPRKRFRGNDPTLKQGGDPRINLELRARRTNQCDDDNKNIISWLEKSVVHEWLQNEMKKCNDHSSSIALSDWIRESRKHQVQPNIHMAIWRRPFYIKGTYTKARRDVAQSPFYVSVANAGMVRKGVSSVEEEICPRLASSCGGISTKNNKEALVQDGSVVYGMCKFHASGREDMDVRMILPAPSVVKSSSAKITGRPFVCEVFDAFRLPTAKDLDAAVTEINLHSPTTSNGSDSKAEIVHGTNGWPQSIVAQDRFHGFNINGVGVSSPLELTSSRSFSGLQLETESKVKHYGCICWSSVLVRSDKELVEKLGCLPWDGESSEEDAVLCRNNFPLQIKQDTPLRVLHRRSSDTRTRCIITLSACRISNHWIRLRMSTSAGTYVKEFVHGDCGRTYPSISSLLGGRVDITELDCEGIEF
ncbi:hypothetical protein ACHAWC_007958 [Mediolabrus comicus]